MIAIRVAISIQSASRYFSWREQPKCGALYLLMSLGKVAVLPTLYLLGLYLLRGPLSTLAKFPIRNPLARLPYLLFM